MAEVKGRFAIVPYTILADTKLSIYAKAAYTALAVHADKKSRECWPSVATLGRLMGVSKQTVRKAVKELVAAGYVEVEPRWVQEGDRGANLYRLKGHDKA